MWILGSLEHKKGVMKKLFKKYWIVALGLLALIGSLAVKGDKSPNTPSEETLIIGLQSGYPPFEFTDTKGTIIGFDVDLAQIIADRLGKKLIVKDMEFEGEILSLKQKKIDLIISGMNITPSRQQEIQMIPYHGDQVSHLCLVFWGSVPAGIADLNDLAHKGTISVESGSTSELFMQKYAEVVTKSFQGSLAPLMDVKYGKSIASLVEPDVAEYLKKKYEPVQILPVPLSAEETLLGFGIGVHKNNIELGNQVRAIVQELRDSGQLKQLEDKWFRGDLSE